MGPLAARRQMCIPTLFYLEDIADGELKQDQVEERLGKYGSWLEGGLGSNWAFGRRQGGGDAENAICSWLIDDGVGERLHRKNIFNGTFTHIGLAVHPHPKQAQTTLVVFASDFRAHAVPRPTRLSPRAHGAQSRRREGYPDYIMEQDLYRRVVW